ncbi:2-C-methyl-D-erythritol 4-phosphate cytidylyltransferase [Actinomarinicola tropica]|uniref:2-C-methyl-D-erythritol 4-phosphate cytidylyltransferase n=1 Tax=Actinomarinicola tropica TaxID=2789776 RepID=UPI00189A0FEB|nr:2-C-methyl-D-erythritol 4-phosphate cytidylyltransferase [Actinomarinicola tropica]
MSPVHLLAWPPPPGGLPAPPPGAEVVVVHDAGAPPTSDVVAHLLDALVDGVDAVATVRPVTDAVKEVDDDGAVVGVVPRDGLAVVGLPQAVRASAWADRVGAPPAPDATPVDAVVAAGGVVRAVVDPS